MAGSVNWAAVISILVATSISRCVATTANAQTQHDRCAGKEGGAPDLRMAGCTAAMSPKHTSARNWHMLLHRELAYSTKQNSERAIAYRTKMDF